MSGVGDTGVGGARETARRRARVVLYAVQATSGISKATNGMTTARVRAPLEVQSVPEVVVDEPTASSSAVVVVVVPGALEADWAAKRPSGTSIECIFVVWVAFWIAEVKK